MQYGDPRPSDPEPRGALRVAILSDTHGTLDPRIRAVIDTCHLAVHGGDIGCGDLLDSIGHQLLSRGGRLYAVRGNNDLPARWPEPHRARLAELPACLWVDLPGGRLGVIHGHQTPSRGRHARLRRLFPDTRAIVYGHSHRLVIDQLADPWVLNPGAAGRSRTYGGPSCLVLTAGRLGWQVTIHRFTTAPPPLSRDQKHDAYY